MGKRGAEEQLNKDAFEAGQYDDKDGEGGGDSGGFQKASADVLAKRKIVKVKRRDPAVLQESIAAATPVFNFGAPAATPTFNFGTTPAAPAEKWDCGTCMMPNEAGATKCSACEEPKPTSDAAATKPAEPAVNAFASLIPKTNWECNACTLSNKESDLKCASCKADKPSSDSNADANRPKETFNAFAALIPKDNWECNACTLSNAKSDMKCKSCKADKPGTGGDDDKKEVESTSNDAAPKPKYTFGGGASGAAPSSGFTFGGATASGGFTFGTTGTGNTATNFTFGTAVAAKTDDSSAAANGKDSGSSTGAFTFGATPAFTFGSTVTATGFGNVKGNGIGADKDKNAKDVFDKNAKSPQEKKITGEQEKAGDEDDETVHKVNPCKVYKVSEKGSYVEQGKGELKLNTYLTSSKKKRARLIMRAEKVGRLVVNAPLSDQLKVELRNETWIQFGAPKIAADEELEAGGAGGEEKGGGNGEVKKWEIYAIKCKTKEDAQSLKNKIDEVTQSYD